LAKIFLTTAPTSGHLGGLFGSPAATNFWNEGLERAFECLPPIQIAILECSGSLICIGGHGPSFQKLVAAGLPNNPPRWPEVGAVVKKILAVYKGDARDWERVGEWVERIGWPAFFEKTGLCSIRRLVLIRTLVNLDRNLH
jgi:dissimilatory sulfite reductase (desulfoviridin) alpha/beta subunit